MERITLPNGLVVDAGPQAAITERGIDLVLQGRAGSEARIITALHVGGLQHGSDRRFISALEGADLVCADGAAVVTLCRLAGIPSAERAPTTDVGLAILSGAVARGGKMKLAVVGGAEGIAERAGRVLSARTGGELVYASHGYHADWDPVVEALNEAAADVLILGLGSPMETKWAFDRRHELRGTILTCGGWFGFLVGQESRAPMILQRAGLEWVWRLAQSPKRLVGRYIRGMLVTAVLALRIKQAKQVTQ